MSIFVFYCSNKIAQKFRLLDIPNKRKIHKKPIPNIGGLSISIIFILSTYFINFQNNSFNIILIFSILISLAGYIDDRYILNVGSKLIWQLLPISLLIFKFDLIVLDVGNYQIIGKINLGSFSYIFTILCAFLLVNATNYMDGIDGSASIAFLISILNIIFLTNFLNEELYKFYIIICIPLFLFLFFNFNFFKLPKMFLGDSGSLLLGFILSFLMIILYKKYYMHPILLAWGVAFIVFEFLSVNISRMYLNKNLFKPGQDHIHHIFFKKTKSIFKTNVILILINLFIAITGYLSFYLVNDLFSLIFYLITFIFYLFLRVRIKKIKKI
ncbi:undecaprenyl/decaprenyl-phosphate alpha-N-acetylglucosaminyl 1-phosphate transferase [Candidatus Pelagibacter bacterium]|nr:undecaprenyl/decaprenyl-phosphate alpha-N-acetylglucosaminyl 1-phosphate transferase [Candidatus Pelagibacter bacterium]